jgi:hypothetical protein
MASIPLKEHFVKAIPPLIILFLAGTPLAKADDFNTQLMNATVKIAHEKSSASAFFLCRPAANGGQKPQFFLVTAAHFFENLSGDAVTLLFRRQDNEAVYEKVPVKLVVRQEGKRLWTKHPTADVAVLSMTPPSWSQVPQIPLDLLASDETLKANAIHPGDTVSALGFPHLVEGNGFPILRSGPIASYPLTPTSTNKTFLVSINAFEGDSGGPVYMADSNRPAADGKAPQSARLILGLVVGQHFLDEEAKMIYEAVKIRHRLGIAIVLHAAYIKETIDQASRAP